MPDNCSIIQAWKKINLFAVLDGHGGSKCVEFVHENFMKELLKDQNFIEGNFKNALSNTVLKLEQAFFDIILEAHAKKQDYDEDARVDHSGVCATFVLFINRIGYIAHLGDSRVLSSKEIGSLIT